MVDHLSPSERSRNMAAIKSRDTKPELRLRKALRAAGIRGYRVALHDVAGKPDVAFTRWRVAVFVDGAFWHGHPARFSVERANEFWRAKITRNMARDEAVNRALQEEGWTVLRFWDFEVNGQLSIVVCSILAALEAKGYRT